MAATIQAEATIHLDVILAATLDGMGIDVESTDHAPSVKDAIVQVSAGEEVLLLVDEVAGRHVPAGEVEHPLAGDLAAVILAFLMLVHDHLFVPGSTRRGRADVIAEQRRARRKCREIVYIGGS
jgi:hypothetical protein